MLAAPVSSLRALLLSAHPVPTVTVTGLAIVLAAAVGLEPQRMALIGAGMLANQLSVGWSNDWIDADRDRAVGRTDKPVASGRITPGAVRGAAIVAAALSLLLFFLLGPLAGFAHLVFLVSAWSYNAGVKATAASAVPYLVSFGLLPVIIGLAAPEPFLVAWWAIAAAALLGVAAHFANVLPDLQDDGATGVRGLPHRLGGRRAGLFAFGLLAAAGLTATLGLTDLPVGVVLTFIGVQFAIAGGGGALVATRPPRRILFLLILVSALITVLTLALSGQRLRG